MQISYAHHITNRRPKDILSELTDVAPELAEIGGWTKADVRESVIRFMRWYFSNHTSDIAVEIEVFRGESLSMVTASGDGFVIGWESQR
jgi:hypothetical protein